MSHAQGNDMITEDSSQDKGHSESPISLPPNTGDTDIAIQQFAKDFDIQYTKYKYDQKRLIVRFVYVETSNSEIETHITEIPAFLIKSYFKLLEQTRINTLNAAIDALPKKRGVLNRPEDYPAQWYRGHDAVIDQMEANLIALKEGK